MRRRARRRSLARVRPVEHGFLTVEEGEVFRWRRERGTGNRRRQLSAHPHVHRRGRQGLHATSPRRGRLEGLHAGERAGLFRRRLFLRARFAAGNQDARRHRHARLRREHGGGVDSARGAGRRSAAQAAARPLRCRRGEVPHQSAAGHRRAALGGCRRHQRCSERPQARRRFARPGPGSAQRHRAVQRYDQPRDSLRHPRRHLVSG